ncbi:MAG: homocysteine S-methyltransferase family protein [Candidatus Limnocylindrales bacterium]
MLAGGVDAVLVETAQDLLQAKSAIVGAQRAMAAAGRRVPMFVQVTVETTGTMLLGSEIGAALTALEPLGIDLIGLNCATGPAEMSEHLRFLSKNATVGVSVMPNAGLPELGPHGAVYPLSPGRAGQRPCAQFVREFGTTLVGGCCGTTPSTSGRWWRPCRTCRRRSADRAPSRPRPRSTSPCRSGRTPRC